MPGMGGIVEHYASGGIIMILSDNETKFDLLNNKAIATTIVNLIKKAAISLSQLEFMEIGEQENPVFLK